MYKLMANPTQNPGPVPDPPENRPEPLKPGLYLVATPIGNLRDITLRALDVLRSVDAIACEDTRVSLKLLQAYDIKKPLVPYHDHNADEQRPRLLERVASGEKIALISDAGMPLISDPGYKLVRDAQQQGIYVTSLPGANAPLMALQLSGLPTDAFVFLGFLAAKTKARSTMLAGWKDAKASLILFESANRLDDTLKDILEVLGDRPCAVTRELTKYYEDVWPGKVSDHVSRLKEQGPPKGEIVIVIGGKPDSDTVYDLDALLVAELERSSLREAVQTVMDITGLSKKHVYDRALQLRS